MVNRAGGDDENPVGGVVAGEIAADIVRRERHHRLRRAENRPADGLVAKGSAREIVEHHVIGNVVGGADLLHDHVLLARQFLLVEGGAGEDIGQDINREGYVILQDPGVIGRGLGGCRGIDLAADILDLLRDLAGGAALGALEGHVFQKVGDAMLVLQFIARARFDPGSDRNAFDMRHVLGNDGQPGGKPGVLYGHAVLLSF